MEIVFLLFNRPVIAQPSGEAYFTIYQTFSDEMDSLN